MYFDAVLDENLEPIFNGTRNETLNWLMKNENYKYLNRSDYRVVMGDSLRAVSPWEYVNMFT